ncbi:MAG TPA: TrmH family RNA methyltransferase [Spirochaetia bacterium]|nr:TrmH family RNA methyltransferase [Spirochaetia bacterium]
MITLRKWEELPRKTRIRKLALLLQEAEEQLARDQKPEIPFYRSLIASEVLAADLYTELGLWIDRLKKCLEGDHRSPQLERCFNDLRHGILRFLKAEPAEWDLLQRDGKCLVNRRESILPMAVFMEDVRSPYNVGAIFRTSEAFGVREILLSPSTPLPTHPRAWKTSRGCADTVPWRIADLSAVEEWGGAFALETGGTPIGDFPFPIEGGIVLIGSEELGLSPEALELVDNRGGRVSIPMAGSKKSLNVAVAFGILMWNWYARFASKNPIK